LTTGCEKFKFDFGEVVLDMVTISMEGSRRVNCPNKVLEMVIKYTSYYNWNEFKVKNLIYYLLEGKSGASSRGKSSFSSVRKSC